MSEARDLSQGSRELSETGKYPVRGVPGGMGSEEEGLRMRGGVPWKVCFRPSGKRSSFLFVPKNVPRPSKKSEGEVQKQRGRRERG